MPELNSPHIDDFAMLRYVTDDMPAAERIPVEQHLRRCDGCQEGEREIRQLDHELRQLAQKRGHPKRDGSAALPPGDPFRSRPPIVRRQVRRVGSESLVTRALEASGRAGAMCEEILAASRAADTLTAWLSELNLSDLSQRFALLYALQESGRRIAESPVNSLRFGEETLTALSRTGLVRRGEPTDSERIVPRLVLEGQAHLLAGQACTWTKEFDRAGSHLQSAYRCFSRGGGDEMNLAAVEHAESQRRSFLLRGHEALTLARRAVATFEDLGLDDFLARARAAQGNALFALEQWAEAEAVYRSALPVFEKYGLWSNYVGVLNNLGATLAKAGQLDEARRDFARALRRLSREKDRTFVAYIRHGLADVLFAAGRYREAAITLGQASRLYREAGLTASALIASLFEVESWARQGELARARHRLDLFLRELQQHGPLDRSLVKEMEEAFAGTHPDLERIAELRHRTEERLADRRGSLPA